MNGAGFANPGDLLRAGETLRTFEIIPTTTARFGDVGDFREEMEGTVDMLLRAAGGRKISLLISGMDGEAIARLLAARGADFDLWHLRLAFKGGEESELVRRLGRELDREAHVVPRRWREMRARFREDLLFTGIPASMMYCLQSLVALLPRDRYVVSGNGAYRKVGARFARMSRRLGVGRGRLPRGRVIPYDLRDVLGRLLAARDGRDGEFYFHSLNPRQVAALFKSPWMRYDPDTGEIDDKEVFLRHFPELIFRRKTEPWRTEGVVREGAIIRLAERWLGARYPHWSPEQQFLFAPLYVDEVFA